MDIFGPEITLHILHIQLNTTYFTYAAKKSSPTIFLQFLSNCEKFQSEILLTLTYIGIICAHNSIIIFRLAYSFFIKIISITGMTPTDFSEL